MENSKENMFFISGLKGSKELQVVCLVGTESGFSYANQSLRVQKILARLQTGSPCDIHVHVKQMLRVSICLVVQKPEQVAPKKKMVGANGSQTQLLPYWQRLALGIRTVLCRRYNLILKTTCNFGLLYI